MYPLLLSIRSTVGELLTGFFGSINLEQHGQCEGQSSTNPSTVILNDLPDLTFALNMADLAHALQAGENFLVSF